MNLNDTTLVHTQTYIDGQWVGADSGKAFDVVNPADGAIVGSVPDLGVTETRRAIDAANRALPSGGL